jgi:hypothetical protein
MNRTGMLRKAIAVLAIAAGVGVAYPASATAQPVKGTSGPKGCPVENVDANGNTVSTSTVPDGTRVGLFVCINGEWKFGWAIGRSAAAVSTLATGGQPVMVAKA